MSAGVGELSAGSVVVDRAAGLEADSVEFPDQRGMLLLEAARAWWRAGSPARAAELVAEQVAEGGENGCYARVQRVEFWVEDGAWAEAEAELAELARELALDDGHCTVVAELMAEHDRLDDAARWYDRGVARLTPAMLDTLGGPQGWAQLGAVMMLHGRRELRARLGKAPDATDELVADLDGGPGSGRGWGSGAEGLGDPPSLDAVAEHQSVGSRVNPDAV